MINAVRNSLKSKAAILSAGFLALANLTPAKADTDTTVNGITYRIPDAVGATPKVLGITAAGAGTIKIYFNVNQINPNYALVITKDPFGSHPRVTKVVQYPELSQQPTGGEYLYDSSTDQSGALYTISFGSSSTTVTPPVASTIRVNAVNTGNSGNLVASLTPLTPLNSVLPSYVNIEVVGNVTQFGSTQPIRVQVIDGNKINFATKGPRTFVRVLSSAE